MKKENIFNGLIFALLIVLCRCAPPPLSETVRHASNMTLVDRYTLAGDKHLIRDYSPIDFSGNIYVVIEIPTGTTAKWETDKTTGKLKWEFKNGKPRVVTYLGYPGNYGMIPQTFLPKELERDFNGVTYIIETWFSNYKGPGKTRSLGFGGVSQAQKIVKASIEEYGKRSALSR